MSICIIGAGLSGLATAIKLKMLHLKQEVLLIDGFYSGNNTKIAGQRYRERESGKGYDPAHEILNLLAQKNDGKETSEMQLFAKLAISNLQFWKTFNPKNIGVNLDSIDFRDNPRWFGPQFGQENKAGGGRGLSILSWFKSVAESIGVQIISAEVFALNRINEKIQSISAIKKNNDILRSFKSIKIFADYFILAGGNLGGRMFLSTNARIYNSPQELAFSAGLSIVDSTLYMFHIAGFCTADGNPKTGCFETDNLSGFQVYLKNKGDEKFDLLDKKTTKLFEEHKAHYYFDEIAKRFIKHEGRIMLSHPDIDKNLYARVSHHYSHIAIMTRDGVSVTDTSNLFAVGDASGMGYWTGHKVRLPGFALTKCLIDADWILNKADFAMSCQPLKIIEDNNVIPPIFKDRNSMKKVETELQKLNTRFLFDIKFGDSPLFSSEQWIHVLFEFSRKEKNLENNTLFQLTLCTAFSFLSSLKKGIENDCISFSKRTLKSIKENFSV